MDGCIFDTESYAKKAREAAAEGFVLLRNENGVLPLDKGERIALFGRSQFNYYKSGTGSGGMVNTSYVASIRDALKERDFVLNKKLEAAYGRWLKEHPFDAGAGWAAEPWFQQEMPLGDELIANVRGESDTAIVLIGRTAGEDKDNQAVEGSYLLTGAEREMLRKVCTAFDRTVVLLNVGNIIDMKWVEEYRPQAVAYVWHGGQEGGNGVLDILSGTVSPSGKLPDTIARDITDYPSTEHHGNRERNFYKEDIYVGYRYFETFAQDKVLYPFGFGLSYTSFALEESRVEDCGESYQATVTVANTGSVSGREVVQVYCKAPQGTLGQPCRSLCGFAKTKLLSPGEREKLAIRFDRRALSSYDDSGVSGHRFCYVMESGVWEFYVGTDVRSAALAGQCEYGETIVVERHEQALAPIVPFERLRPVQAEGGGLCIGAEPVPQLEVWPADRRMERLPASAPYTGDQGYKLEDVESGAVTMEMFLAQLSDEDLTALVCGEGMCSPKVTPGTAGACGGVTESLKAFGIPIACCADGPSGIRMDCGSIAFAMPNGTCLASSFNEALTEELYEWEGLEMRKNKIDALLGPGINIHRNPLNGRNFEYFSEDPLLTGRIASAQLKGMNRFGVTGTIKHLVCNNQESNRHRVEAVVSERALREIYLRPFEIAVKEGRAYSVMTSYNPVNGYWTASSYDLTTTILRREWGYDGIVMTDWWARGNNEPGDMGERENAAAMARAQNDLYMVVANAQESAQRANSMAGLAAGTVIRGEYLRSASNICHYLLRTPAWLRFMGEETDLDRGLAECALQEADTYNRRVCVDLQRSGGVIPEQEIDTSKGSAVLVELASKARGTYKLVFECCVCGQESLAQIPLTISQNRQIVKIISLTGEDREWIKEEVLLAPIFSDTYFLKFYFGQGGMKLRNMRMTLAES